MINVVGAGQDPEKLSSATTYDFVPQQPVKPAPPTPTPPQVPAPPPTPTPPSAPITPVLPSAPLTEKVAGFQQLFKFRPSKKVLIAAISFGVLTLGIGLAIYLNQQPQDVRQQASETTDSETEFLAAAPSLTPIPTLTPRPSTTPTPIPTLTPKPSATPTPATQSVSTTENCDESCFEDENCQNPALTCIENNCRLASNPTDTACYLISGGSIINLDNAALDRVYTPFATPSGETPASGPMDWLRYGLVGMGLLTLGGLALLAFW